MATDYTSGAINFTGLGSGTDFNALIDGLVDAEMTRVTRLETWRSSWETKNEQFQALNTQMLSLKSTLQGFDTVNEFLAKTVSTSNSTLLSATADSDAQEAAHTIEIGQLATSDVFITTSGASAMDSTVTSSDFDFTFSYGGESYTISNVSAGTTLEGFVNIINNHVSSKDKIRASTLYDGSVYHLQLNGIDQGADNQLVISNTGSMIFSASDFHQTQEAVNSQIRVNGFPSASGGWIERSSNSIDDVIEGITLNLNDSSVGTDIKLNVNTDISAVKQNIVKFVDAINIVRAQIQAITEVDEDGQGSILTGNYGIDIVGQNIKNITANLGNGFVLWDEDTLTGDRFSSLSQIGILTDAENGSTSYGLLTIDEEKLDEALSQDPDAVANLLSAHNDGQSLSPNFTYTSLIDGTTQPGVYDIEIESDGSQITSAKINGEDAKISGWEITGLSGDATGLALRLDNTGAGSYTGQISVKQGKAGEMIDELSELTKPYNEFTYEGGPLAVLQENYNDIMDSIDKKIDYETTRINKLETNMKLKFARLDALLGQYELQQGQLESQLGQLE